VRVPDLGVTCAALGSGDKILHEPLLLIEILSRSNRAETWSNVWSYVTIPSVQEILVLHTADIRADLLLRQADGSWPEDPRQFVAEDVMTPDSIGFRVPIAAFYRWSIPSLILAVAVFDLGNMTGPRRERYVRRYGDSGMTGVGSVVD
jgi:Uma2 family endonuclease